MYLYAQVRVVSISCTIVSTSLLISKSKIVLLDTSYTYNRNQEHKGTYKLANYFDFSLINKNNSHDCFCMTGTFDGTLIFSHSGKDHLKVPSRKSQRCIYIQVNRNFWLQLSQNFSKNIIQYLSRYIISTNFPIIKNKVRYLRVFNFIITFTYPEFN